MSDKMNAEHFPWLQNRMNDDAKPTYKIIARSMSLGGDSIVMLHKAGNDFVENYYIRDLVTHADIMTNMDEKESALLRWVVQSEITDPLKCEPEFFKLANFHKS
ncbi:MAG: hypothetical protein A3F13_08260 [Gammaproteobacteria bacterium RIFCSPHIGHO2_12_FULL_40_19]|nr:MAG: hypothetical protein A3F13_08260 [Gammaproteobacteria bacterium RIFCSPHIGHO2_12_FULL_40_19]